MRKRDRHLGAGFLVIGAVGGSGIVIIRYLDGAVNASGGTETSAGGYTRHTFTSTGDFVVS